MRFAIVASNKDSAGMSIVEELEKQESALPVCVVEEETIYANIDTEKLDADFIVFASKHESMAKKKTLSVHAPGNFHEAKFGGKPSMLCKTSSFVLKYLFLRLKEFANAANIDYHVTLEVTHHGPYIDKPCCFIEIGSTHREWQDKNAAEVVAKSIMSLLDFKPEENWVPAIGLGGPHYCPNFSRIQLETSYALGHIAPNYALPLSKSLTKEMVNKTVEQPRIAIVDWKGLGNKATREATIKLLNELSLEVIRTSHAK